MQLTAIRYTTGTSRVMMIVAVAWLLSQSCQIDMRDGLRDRGSIGRCVDAAVRIGTGLSDVFDVTSRGCARLGSGVGRRSGFWWW